MFKRLKHTVPLQVSQEPRDMPVQYCNFHPQSMAADYDIVKADASSEKDYPIPVNKTPDEVKARVQAFYLRSDNCYMAPGRKDSITVNRDGDTWLLQ